MNNRYDPSFRAFAKALERTMDSYKIAENEEDLTKQQEEQINRLVAMERCYRDTLVRLDLHRYVYGAFVDHILNERGNILTARPFFRERQKNFDQHISPAIRNRDIDSLIKWGVNFQFIQFAHSLDVIQDLINNKDEAVEGFFPEDLALWYNEIKKLRNQIIETNLPLAISRARLFFDKTPESHHSFMDFVQIATEGLIAAVDKFVPPYTTVFRAVAIGRMLGNFIFEYNKTPLHFYPSDRRKLYHANRAAMNCEEGDYETIAEIVNIMLAGEDSTTPSEIQQLMAAASVVSSDVVMTSEEGEDSDPPIVSYAAPDSYRPDVQYERAEEEHLLQKAIQQLTLFEKKLLQLKGVHING